LWLSFLALGIGSGDECITTTNTFFATAEAIWIAGATAVFVDSDPRTNCLDPSRVEADDRRIHPCNFESAYKAFEITMAFCRSVAERGQIKLPLASSADELEMLRLSLPPRDVLLSMAANAREYQS